MERERERESGAQEYQDSLAGGLKKLYILSAESVIQQYVERNLLVDLAGAGEVLDFFQQTTILWVFIRSARTTYCCITAAVNYCCFKYVLVAS